MRQFEIFKKGTHTAANGATLSFSEDDLTAAVAAYDPAKHEAPIVVGHPKDNLPAYGWVGKLDYLEGVLVAHPKDVDPEFAEMVKAGRFKKRSASFYSPDAKNNPVPGTFYLRHVGFLGAAAPAVKGLKDVEFASDAEGIVEFEEDWIVTGILARLFSGLRDFMLATYGQEKADQVIPKYAVEDLAQAARDAQPKAEPAAAPSFTEDTSMTPEQIAALQAENTKLKADNAKLTADFSEAQKTLGELKKTQDIAAIKAAIDPHVKAGKVLPAEVDQLASFAAGLDDATATFDFTDGDKTSKVTARAMFLAQLGQRAKVVDFSERSGKDKDKDEPSVGELQRQVMDQVSGKAAKK
jgi:hypothetical protein